MSNPANIIIRKPPNLIQKSNVQLVLSDFDALVHQKGYNVFHDKMLSCPCRSEKTDQLVSCQNCASIGFVLIQRIKTKMVIQSINLDTKYREWSEERLGTIKITALSVDRLAFMDRITLLDAESTHNQVLFPKVFNNKLFTFTIYDINKITDLFFFIADDKPLRRLEEITDFTIGERNQIIFNDKFKKYENFTISVRYTHAPQFHVLEITREIMRSDIEGLNKQTVLANFPVAAIGRRSHFVITQDNFTGDFIIDNSYIPEEECK